MIVIVDDRDSVKEGFSAWFNREGVATAALSPKDLSAWVGGVADADIIAIEAFLLGEWGDRRNLPKLIKNRCSAVVIALNENKSLEDTLDLFASGVDDVVRKPVHVKEILARINAIQRRGGAQDAAGESGDLRVFFDGRDPEVKGEVLPLPRRERRILEYLMSNQGKRVTKTQLFNAVYGIFDEDIDENVVESHISKLRKRLRQRLGHDPIDSQRYLGYRMCA